MLHRMDGATTRPAEAEAPPKIRVLLVDDHAVVRRGLKGFFELLDDIVIVGEAEDGAQAVQLVEQHQPDVVLMDLLMPGMDGIEATRRIRALPSAAGRIPIIGVSGRTDAGDEAAARAAGMDGYLRKPASPADLHEALQKAAEVRSA